MVIHFTPHISVNVGVMKSMKSMGPMTFPWGTPLVIFDHSDGLPLTNTLCLLPVVKAPVHLDTSPCTPYAVSCVGGALYRKVSQSQVILYQCIQRNVDNDNDDDDNNITQFIYTSNIGHALTFQRGTTNALI